LWADVQRSHSCKRSAPKRGDGRGDDIFGQFEEVRTGVKDDTSYETISDLLMQPSEMGGITSIDCRRRFDFDARDFPSAIFNENIDLMPLVPIPQVMESGTGRAEISFRAKLINDEGFNKSSQ
jgi:hypothetical protein